jgi:hypothetical protein
MSHAPRNPESSTTNGISKRMPEWLYLASSLLAVFVLGLALRLYALDADSLWLDEIFTVTTSRLDLRSMPSFLATSDTHPPMLYVVAKLAIGLWGGSEFAIRLPAALLGSVSVLLVFKVGEILWGRKEGLIAAFLLAISAYHVQYSQEARDYSLMVFFSLLSLVFLLKALGQGRKRMWLLFAVCTSLNIYTHDVAFLVLASELLFAAWVIVENWRKSRRESAKTSPRAGAPADSNHRSTPSESSTAHAGLAGPDSARPPDARRQTLSLVAALALVGVSYLPWLPFLYQQIGGGIIEFEGVGPVSQPGGEPPAVFLSEAFEAYTGMEGIFLLMLLALLVTGLATSPASHIVLLGTWILAPFLFLFVVRSGHHISIRYAIHIVPVLYLGVARGTSVLTGWLTRRLPLLESREKWRLVLTAALTVSVFGGLSIQPLNAYYVWEKADYRGVVRYLDERLLPHDIVLVDGIRYRTTMDAGWSDTCLSYYMDYQGAQQWSILPVERGLWSKLQDAAQSEGKVVMVLARGGRPRFWDRQPEISVVDFEDLSVVRLRQPSGDTLQDALSMVEMLLDLLRLPVARFDVHLALAEAYAQMGRDVDAASQLVLASVVRPDNEYAIDDLREAGDELLSLLDLCLEDAQLGDVLSISGHRLSPSVARADDTIHITIWWRTLATMDTDYTAFIHILGPDGRVLAQEDRLLQDGPRLTSRWEVEEVVTDEYEIILPFNTEPGEYAVKAGVYNWETGERLPLWDDTGQRLPGNALDLQPLTVLPSN